MLSELGLQRFGGKKKVLFKKIKVIVYVGMSMKD